MNADQCFSLHETYTFSFFSVSKMSSRMSYRTEEMEENVFKQKCKLGHPD